MPDKDVVWVVVLISRSAALVRSQVYQTEAGARRRARALKKVGWHTEVIRHPVG